MWKLNQNFEAMTRLLFLFVIVGCAFGQNQDAIDRKSYARALQRLSDDGKPWVTIHVLDSSAGESVSLATGTPRTVTEITLGVRMPDGTVAVLACKQQLRYCTPLSPGDYSAHVQKETVWIYVMNYLDKPRYDSAGVQQPRRISIDRVKYRIVTSLPPTAVKKNN